MRSCGWGGRARWRGNWRALVAAEPLRERLAELLMLALYRSGQQSAALGVYRAARRALVDQVGIEPGPGLREMNQKILLSDPPCSWPRPGPGRGPRQRSAAVVGLAVCGPGRADRHGRGPRLAARAAPGGGADRGRG